MLHVEMAIGGFCALYARLDMVNQASHAASVTAQVCSRIFIHSPLIGHRIKLGSATPVFRVVICDFGNRDRPGAAREGASTFNFQLHREGDFHHSESTLQALFNGTRSLIWL